MKKIWINKNPDKIKVSSLMNETNASKYLCSALVNRGLTDIDNVLKFLKPDIKNLYNPFLLKGMDKAVKRIKRAIREGETICLHTDYD